MNTKFCEKYKPKKISELIGNEYQIDELKRLLKNFDKPKYKCFLITGPHGSGKSCFVNTILNECGYEMRTFDAQKFKQADNPLGYINELVSTTNIMTLFGYAEKKKYAIVVDELGIDVALREKSVYVNLMKMNNDYHICPIIFIFDTKHNKLINALRKGTNEICIREPSDDDIMLLLKKLCFNEKIRIRSKCVADRIVRFAQHDYRRLCTILSDISNNLGASSINDTMIDKYECVMSEKNIVLDLFSSAKKLLSSYENLENCMKSYELEKVNMPLMMHQNYPSRLSRNMPSQFGVIEKLTDSLSFGDVVDNYVYGEQRWDITCVHGFFACCMPSYLLHNIKNGNSSMLKFPVDMNKTSIKKLNRKHIISASKNMNSVDGIDYVYMSKLFTSMFKNDEIDRIKQIMQTYKLSLDDMETILKIDKCGGKNKPVITTKQKKMLK